MVGLPEGTRGEVSKVRAFEEEILTYTCCTNKLVALRWNLDISQQKCGHAFSIRAVFALLR